MQTIRETCAFCLKAKASVKERIFREVCRIDPREKTPVWVGYLCDDCRSQLLAELRARMERGR